MLSPKQPIKVFLAVGATDLRKAINGLSVLVAEQLQQDPFSGHLFGFCNRGRDMIKILYWDCNGFCLWQKRLERNRFNWPQTGQEVMGITIRELQWLLDGLSLTQADAYQQLTYSILS